jgi:hypothetical protein
MPEHQLDFVHSSMDKVRTPYSNQSSSYFFQLVEDIGRFLEPTSTQLDTLARSYQSTGEFLTTCPEFDGLLLEIHPHGSRELGTMTRPLDSNRDGFDIDLIARLDKEAISKYNGERGPTLLLDHLFTALKRYAERHKLKIHRWDRCVTLEYADGMCADIAPVIDSPIRHTVHGETHGWIPDRDLQRFQSTNPRGYVALFDKMASISPVFTNDQRIVNASAEDHIKRADIVPLSNADEVFGRLLCRVVQLIKLHRNVVFGSATVDPDLAPQSSFITSLAAAAYTAQAPQPHDSPLELLLDIVETMPQYFIRRLLWEDHEEWYLQNPTAPGDNLASAMNSRNRQKAFLAWHVRLIDDLRKILQAIEGRAGIDKVGQLIEATFGVRAANAMQLAQVSRQEAIRKSGKASIITSAATVIPMTARAHSFFGREE